ncbi:MAG: polysaccharide pyruvyl transferase family protein, partial [Proteobacteria bacterium]|nr:polysaccharide pyruvyl transferase family protein [Pseudomonadota bacterium]
VTVGPCRTKRGKEMLKTVMDMMDFITVRDQDSVDELREAKVENPNVLITNDCALNTKPSSKERIAKIRKEIGLPETGEILALNVNPYFDSWAGLSGKKLTREVFINTYASAVTKAVKNIDATLMFVSTQHLDETLTKDIMSKINTHHKKVYFSNRVYSPQDIRGLMAQVSLLFAMRLHCLILTSAGHTPIISLNYLPKVETYLKSLDLKDYSLDFSNFSEENIAKHIEKGWQDRQQIREKLNAKIPAMKFEAFKAAILVDSLSRGFSMDEEIARLKNTKPESSLLQVNS